MALLYGAICSSQRDDRLRALARLRDEAYNYQGLEMPYNTRRILIALMKETVKAKGELELQRRYIAAFRQALSGRAYVVRTMLDELGLAEVPEAVRRTLRRLGRPSLRQRRPRPQDSGPARPGRLHQGPLATDDRVRGLPRDRGPRGGDRGGRHHGHTRHPRARVPRADQGEEASLPRPPPRRLRDAGANSPPCSSPSP